MIWFISNDLSLTRIVIAIIEDNFDFTQTNENANRNTMNTPKKQNHQDDTGHDRVILQCYSIGELADLYGVSKKVLGRMMFENGVNEKRKGRYYTIMQVEIIFNRLGIPKKLME